MELGAARWPGQADPPDAATTAYQVAVRGPIPLYSVGLGTVASMADAPDNDPETTSAATLPTL